MSLTAVHRSEVGRMRPDSEDGVRWLADPTGGRGDLLVVADGIGKGAAGRMASRVAVEAIAEVYRTSSAPPHEALVAALARAGDRVVRAREEQSAGDAMAATCTLLWVNAERAFLAHVGDTRAYRLRGTAITRLTRDQSVWAERVRRGAAPSSEDGRHQLTEAIGLGSVEPYVRGDIDVRAGDRFLLCSHGLWGWVTDPELGAIAAERALDVACDRLLGLAHRRGGLSGITVVLAEAGTGT